MDQKKAFMFEQLLEHCDHQPASVSRLLGIDSNQMDFNCDEQELAGRLYEKYAGTWWEVSPGCRENGDCAPVCVYLADSLQDALRLRPQTGESYWQNALKYFDQMLANMYDMEEECI